MNKKGQPILMVGSLIVAFVAVIVGLALFADGGISNFIAGTTTLSNYNSSTGSEQITPVSGAYTKLAGKVVTNFEARNRTSGVVIASGNYTLTDNVVIDGNAVAVLNATGGYAGQIWNVSYTYQPFGYISDSGGRAVTTLVLVMIALAIGVIALTPTLRSGLLEMIGK